MGTILDHLASKYEEELDRLKEHVASGQCEDFGGYAHVCGQIRGLKSALTITNDLAKQQEDNDD
jgi:hypothetical protein